MFRYSIGLAGIGVRRSAWVLCVLVAACGSAGGPAPETQMNEAKGAAAALEQATAQDCPWPSDVERYEETAPAGRNPHSPVATTDTFGGVQRGCAVVTFSLNEDGSVADPRVVVESPAGFGAASIAALRVNAYATGSSSLTSFIVRFGLQKLPSGGALMQMNFKGRIINVIVQS